jgi:hypothetical protein
LLKFTTHALGASRAVSRPYSTIGGIVRTAMAKPAGPTVSWPTTPCAIVVASSAARCAMPPTRILAITKSAPVMHGSGVGCACTATAGAIRLARSAITARRG